MWVLKCGAPPEAFYGEKSSITVESEPDSGTIFTITIPYNLTEVSDDEFINGE